MTYVYLQSRAQKYVLNYLNKYAPPNILFLPDHYGFTIRIIDTKTKDKYFIPDPLYILEYLPYIFVVPEYLYGTLIRHLLHPIFKIFGLQIYHDRRYISTKSKQICSYMKSRTSTFESNIFVNYDCSLHIINYSFFYIYQKMIDIPSLLLFIDPIKYMSKRVKQYLEISTSHYMDDGIANGVIMAIQDKVFCNILIYWAIKYIFLCNGVVSDIMFVVVSILIEL